MEKQNRIKEIKKFVETDGFYKDGDFIGQEELAFLSTLNSRQLRSLFPSEMLPNSIHLTIEKRCQKCDMVEKQKIPASAVYKRGSGIFDTNCQKCQEKIRNDALQKVVFANKIEREQRNRVFETFVSPDYSFEKNVKPWRKVKLLETYIPPKTEYEPFALELQRLDYTDFLATPYWDAIASKVRFRDNYKCALCGESRNLRVHHKTYEHRGYEWFYLDDLILLCNNCHEKFHEIGGDK